MSGSQVLMELARQVRGDTLRTFDAAKDGWLTWSPEGTTNHILWHAGHAVWLQDYMCVEPLAGASQLPPAWSAMFAGGSRPASIQAWPSRRQIRSQLEDQLVRMLDLLRAVKDEELRGPAAGLSDKRNLMSWILHGLHDEAKHCGEMYLLWKLCDAARPS